MITVNELLNITKNKLPKTQIKFKWSDDNYEWECDGMEFPNKETTLDKYQGIGFFHIGDEHKIDWNANCGEVTEVLKEFLNKGITNGNSIIGYDTGIDERYITIQDKGKYLLAIVDSNITEWCK